MSNVNQTLAGRHILVTGGARRIGAAIVRELARAGAHVVIHCRESAEAAQATAREARACGVQAWVVTADLADPADVERCMDAVLVATGGKLDGLVNNASHYPPSHLLSVPP